MNPNRAFHVVILAGASEPSIDAAFAAYRVAAPEDIDEVHVAGPHGLVDRLRAALAAGEGRALVRQFGARGAVFGRTTLHDMGTSGPSSDAFRVADEALRLLSTLCQRGHRITILVAADAGVIGFALHTALQLAGGADDRVFVAGASVEIATEAGTSTPSPGALCELPLLFGERVPSPDVRYDTLATERRRARQRQLQPGLIAFDRRRFAVSFDGTELPVPGLRFYWAYAVASLSPRAFPARLLQQLVSTDRQGRISIAGADADRERARATVVHLCQLFATLFPDRREEFPQRLSQVCGPVTSLPVYIAKFNAQVKAALDLGAAPYLIRGGRSGGYRFQIPLVQLALDADVAIANPRARRADDHGQGFQKSFTTD